MSESDYEKQGYEFEKGRQKFRDEAQQAEAEKNGCRDAGCGCLVITVLLILALAYIVKKLGILVY